MKIYNPQQLHINDFDYNLPDDRIAKYPLSKRDESKLLVYRNDTIGEDVFSSVTSYIPSGSLMIFNNTKVIQARMFFRKPTGAQIEIFCLEPHQPHDYALIFQQTRKCSWYCLIGNLKKWKDGELSKTVYIDGNEITLTANRLHTAGDSHIVEFVWDNQTYTFSDLLENGGELPIPPYLNRQTEEKDKETYQTLYSKIKGSVAAPTAGLHFTEDVFSDLEDKGIRTAEVTLHVGAGTFKPVKSETIEGHTMHNEFIAVSKNTIGQLIENRGKVIAVGTTSVRTLESLYYIGSLLEDNPDVSELKVLQWQPYDEANNQIGAKKALQNILHYLDRNELETLFADTQIIIAPGYEFKIVEGIVTNFHQPKSTLLLLVSAFVKGNWKEIYDYALSHDFRFLSYGDSSILLRD
ncbi:S-adenosylmethionine:tRNA ribosyltransferase-isomerase [Dysgonomonas sp. 216]|uniref:S-adenosylmethionine:tRNA ribosyltransferase-isomerase n=1 Tax=Dysgonomonas sp. 216 TaxID=2302934 RepID=UPI0013D4B100|nr:S-adenosylmethionine:tRNA ribosyltransferase-isomerase [Dysgonomonas sp. 216]